MRRLHDEEREAQQREKPVALAAPVSHAARMLALQRTAGNHAVAAMLAREAKPKQAEPAPGLAIVEGLGSIPVVSIGLGEQRASPDREHPATSREISLMSKQGEFSAALATAHQRGDAFEVELFVGDKVRVKLHKAVIASFSVSDGPGGDGPMDSWSLNAESVEFITDGDKR
jgi:hypothetical protein